MDKSTKMVDWREAFGEWWSTIGFDFCDGLSTQDAALAGWRARNSEIDELRAEVERLRATLDMVAEERDAWEARALGLPQAPCRHADHPAEAC
jgi:hypothetical protein